MAENESERQKRLLVVDDEPGFVHMLRTGLEKAGYEVVTALSGQAAVAQARETDPDLVILDIAMPGMTGWEVLERIEADPATAGVPVIMLTALSAEADVIRGLEEGAIDYITKPFDLHHLLSVVRMILDKLDHRGQESYRQQRIAQRKHLMRSLQELFPDSGAEGAE